MLLSCKVKKVQYKILENIIYLQLYMDNFNLHKSGIRQML